MSVETKLPIFVRAQSQDLWLGISRGLVPLIEIAVSVPVNSCEEHQSFHQIWRRARI